MDRIPKYTAGMFKKKMPRFGASSITKPRLPSPPKPRVKKFTEGGRLQDVKDMKRDPEWEREVKEMLRERKIEERGRSPYKGNVKAAGPYIIPEPESFDEMPFKKAYGIRRKELGEGGSFLWRGKPYVVKSAEEKKAKGGTIKSSASRGDGIAKKGKTRGKFV